MTTGLSIASLLTSFGAVTYILMQVLKTLFEKLPGIMLPANQGLHDNALRLIQYVINLLWLVAAARWGGTTIFNGWQWWDFIFVTFGTATFSQITFSFGNKGSTTPATTPAPLQASTTSTVPAVLAPSDIPTIPR